MILSKNKLNIKICMILFFCIAFCYGAMAVSSFFATGEEVGENALVLEQSIKADTKDTIEITLDNAHQIEGTHLGINLKNVYSINTDGSSSAIWTAYQITITDDTGATFVTSLVDNNAKIVPSALADGTYVETYWSYGYVYPTVDFDGVIYLPLTELNAGTTDNPSTPPTNIKKIKFQIDTTLRSKTKTYLFDLIDATLTIPSVEEKIIGDVKILEDFETLNIGDGLTTHSTFYDFSTTDQSNIVAGGGNTIDVRTMTDSEKSEYESQKDDAIANAWVSQFSHTGQAVEFSAFDNGEYGDGMKWEYGSYLLDYDSSLNSYGSAAITPSTTDWSGALGLTIWVKNEQSYPASFNLEFAEQEDGGLERWNLNSDYYRKIYAYDMVTGEEYAFHCLTYVSLPANFEGWLRIPFSEYEVPTWNLAYDYVDSKLDLSKAHTNVYITSMFSVNDGVTLLFDNVGLYYENFEVGTLFDRQEKSILECLSIENYDFGGLN